MNERVWLAVAVDGEGLAAERLADERGNGAAVGEPHPRSVRVEDTHDARVEPVVPVIRHGHGLGEALGLVVDAAGADGVDVAPVLLVLRVHEGIAVDLRRRREEELGAARLGEAERLVGAEGADLQRRDGQLRIVDGRGRAREVQHVVDGPVDDDVVGHVVLDEQESLVADVGDIVDRPGEQAVHADHLAVGREEEVAEMRADEAGAARDEHAHRPSLRRAARACARSSSTRSPGAACARAPTGCARRRSAAAARGRAGARGSGT